MDRIEKLRLLLLGDKTNASADDTINVLIELATGRFLLFLHKVQANMGLAQSAAVPSDLAWVIDEAVIKRFNRIGSEGYQSQSVEGHSIIFSQADFDEFKDEIESYLEDAETLSKMKAKVVIY